MLSNNFKDFIAYFRQLATEHTGINHFAHGPAKRILDSTRAGFSYPCLWLETPSLHLTDKDGTAPDGKRQCALVVLTQCSGTYQQEDEAWDLTEQLALDVISRLREDRKKRLFAFDGNVQLDAISSLTNDLDFGWRIEFETSKTTGLCYRPGVWNLLPAATI